MKLLFTSIISVISIIALAQAPQKISYQAVARQVSGAVISNAPIGVKFIIYQGSVGGTISYEETHNANTNQFGLFTLFIGGGSPSIGAFNTINWATGPYFIETQIDPAGGTSYASIGTQQLMSVPYALFAERAGNASPTPTITINTPNTIANPTTGVYNISVPSYSAGTGISISSGIITNTASSITPTLVAGTNMIVNPTVASNSYTVSSPNYSLSTPSNTLLLLSNGINNSTAIIPAQLLSLSGSTLSVGVPTNSVNLSSLPSLWTASGSTLYPTTATNIGIGTTTPNNLIQVAGLINFENNGSNTSLGLNTGTGILPNNTFNTFVGYFAGQNVGTGSASGNTFVGYNSGANSSNGNNNSFFGRLSGGNNTLGSNNTFIGSGADLFSPIQRTNATAIGYNAKVDTNNAIVLGSPGVNVGIGVTKPSALLHILSSNTNTLVLDKQLKIGHTNQPTSQWIFSVDAAAHMSLKNENTGTPLNVMDFDSNFGYVGINNMNPQYHIDVNGAGHVNGNFAVGPIPSIQATAQVNGGVYSNIFKLMNAGTQIFNVANASGKTIIGTGNASAVNQLDVEGSVAIGSTYAGSLSAPTNGLIVEGSLGVGTGTTLPVTKLDIVDNQPSYYVGRFKNTGVGTSTHGFFIDFSALASVATSNYYIAFARAGSLIGSITGNGTGGVQYNTTSDRRLKENISDFSGALAMIEKIKPRTYNFISSKKNEVGFIAQELQEVFPSAVKGTVDSDPTKDPMMIDYSRLTPLLMGGIKEQQNIIKEQQSQIDEMKKQLQILLDKVSQLEKK